MPVPGAPRKDTLGEVEDERALRRSAGADQSKSSSVFGAELHPLVHEPLGSPIEAAAVAQVAVERDARRAVPRPVEGRGRQRTQRRAFGGEPLGDRANVRAG